jgi:nitroimidazol reductase NimA-like FMN-containing flavoprotein (pyridoxamine 5'-phosphate oxidase superfamily)
VNDTYHLRRHDKAMADRAAIEEVLTAARYVTIAMCADEQPYLVALNHGYDRERGCLYFHCAPDGRKMDILARNSRVWGMAVLDLGYQDGECDHAYLSVMFGGRVAFLTSDEDKRRALEVMVRKQERDPERVIAEQMTDTRVTSVTVGRIDLEHMTGKEALPTVDTGE